MDVDSQHVFSSSAKYNRRMCYPMWGRKLENLAGQVGLALFDTYTVLGGLLCIRWPHEPYSTISMAHHLTYQV